MRFRMTVRRLPFLAGVALVLALATPAPALAADLPGEAMSLLWAVPFAGILVCLATGPLLYPRFWERHYGKIALAWALLVVIPLAAAFGFRPRRLPV